MNSLNMFPNFKATVRDEEEKAKNTFLFHILQLRKTLGGHSLGGPAASLVLQQNRKAVVELRREGKTKQTPEAVGCSALQAIPTQATTNISKAVTGDFSLSFSLLKLQARPIFFWHRTHKMYINNSNNIKRALEVK